jgi:hypothetical protein
MYDTKKGTFDTRLEIVDNRGVDSVQSEPVTPVIDNLEDAHGKSNPSLANLRKREYR